MLLAHVLNKPRTWVLAHPELALTTEQQDQLNQALARLESGEPFPYVLGHWEFFGLDFDITPDVLIPRPETEILVEKAILWLQRYHPNEQRLQMLVQDQQFQPIAINVPNANIVATDISKQTLQVAQRNAEKHLINERINFIACDLLPDETHPPISPPLTFDLICANLPYIPTETLHSLPIYRREPTLALDGGTDGLELIRRLLHIAPRWLSPDGLMLLEIQQREALMRSILHMICFRKRIYNCIRI